MAGKKLTISWDEQEEIGRIRVEYPIIDKKIAAEIIAGMQKLISQHGKIAFIADVSPPHELVNKEGRELLIKEAKQMNFKKIGIVSDRIASRSITNLFIAATGFRDTLKHFADLETALTWVKK